MLLSNKSFEIRNRLENNRGLKDVKYIVYKEIHKHKQNKVLEEYHSRYTWYTTYPYGYLVRDIGFSYPTSKAFNFRVIDSIEGGRFIRGPKGEPGYLLPRNYWYSIKLRNNKS